MESKFEQALPVVVVEGNPKAEAPMQFGVNNQILLSEDSYHGCRHNPEEVFSRYTEADKDGCLPRCSADNTATLILRLNGIEFKVHELCNVANERKDFAHTIMN